MKKFFMSAVTSFNRNHMSDVLSIVLLTAACFIPFVNKAFHIDDPLYLWTAKHIQVHPLDFYGYWLNWEGIEKPMSTVMQNPPLHAYFLALFGRLFNWSEVALHLGLIIPAIAVTIGTYFLAGKFCINPLLSALIVLCSPAFLVSGTNVMGDIMLAALFVWAVYWWMHGLENDRALYLGLAVCMMIFAVLTKYFGLVLVPLLFIYTLTKKRLSWSGLIFLALPVAVFFGYQLLSSSLYGENGFTRAASYAMNLTVGGGFFSKLLTLLAFIGGCLLPVLFFLPLLSHRKGVVAFGLVIASLALFLSMSNMYPSRVLTPGVIAQFALFIGAGLLVFSLSCLDLVQERTGESLLLCIWILGTMIFTGFVNWTVSARNILPLIPPAAILIARRLSRVKLRHDYLPYLLLVPSLVISLTVAWADYQLANSARTAAKEIRQTHPTLSNTLYFQGHWGYQYYLAPLGGMALDFYRSPLRAGDIVVIPRNNSYIKLSPDERAVLLQTMEFTVPGWVTTMNGDAGAGFYSDGWGPLPFVFRHVPPERYYIFMVR